MKSSWTISPTENQTQSFGRGIVDPSFVLAASMIILGGLPRLEANCWCETILLHALNRFDTFFFGLWNKMGTENRTRHGPTQLVFCLFQQSVGPMFLCKKFCGPRVSFWRTSKSAETKNIMSFFSSCSIGSYGQRSFLRHAFEPSIFPTYERTFLNKPWKHNTRKSKQPLCQSSWSSHTTVRSLWQSRWANPKPALSQPSINSKPIVNQP